MAEISSANAESLIAGFDVVLDAVGKSTFGACRRLLRPDGRYLSTDLGPWWQNPLLQVWTRIVGGPQAGRHLELALVDRQRLAADASGPHHLDAHRL